MTFRLIGSLLLAASLTACGTGGAHLTATPSAVGTTQTQSQPRLLVEGVFSLPASLVSVGSGGLVSVGSGQIVSTGSAMFRVQSLGMVPVADAVVGLKRTGGQAVAAVNSVLTDAQGRYRLVGLAAAGAYRVEASHNGQRYMSLANVGTALAVVAAIDVATTLVAARV
ncbi:MAG: hypothetical protein ACK46X_18005, partial [Candidatus Sericytochromatia bacterium]